MKNRIVVKEIIKLILPYRRSIIAISFIMLITSVGSFITPWLTKQLIDIGIINGEFKKTVYYIVMILVVFIFQKFFEMIQFYFYSDVCIKVPYDLNYKACKQLLSVRIKYFKERNFSEVISELFQDISNISSLTDSHFLASIVNLFQIIAGIVALLLINYKLTLIMLIMIPIRLFLSRYLLKRRMIIFQKVMEIQTRFSSWLGDGISGIVEIKLWGISKKRIDGVKKILEESNKEKKKLLFMGQVDNISSDILSTSFTCILYFLGSMLIKNNELTIGGLVSFISYSALVLQPINIISYIITQFSTIIPAFKRFSLFLATEKEEDSREAKVYPSSDIINEICFEDVSFVYDTETILSNINFTIKKGEKVAIIGTNGSGKTSLINLLLGLYLPTNGRIKINDNDIRTFTIESYRSLFSYMAQNYFLFNDSIINNINLAGDLTEKDIAKSCEASGANLFVEKLPEGMNKVIGYNGAKLSGGEKQKIALARTMARKNAKILILDEATSNFDYHSEQNFNDSLIGINQYDITIIITHRPDILKRLDKVLYIDQGKIIEVGKFEKLYSNNKVFKNMIDNNEEILENAIYSV